MPSSSHSSASARTLVSSSSGGLLRLLMLRLRLWRPDRISWRARRLQIVEEVALSRQMLKPVLLAAKPNGKTLRFVPKGLRAQRARLGLSAAQLGRLVQMSDQTIYNWERGVTRPGREQLVRLAQMRALSKRGARAHLEQLTTRSARPRKAG